MTREDRDTGMPVTKKEKLNSVRSVKETDVPVVENDSSEFDI